MPRRHLSRPSQDQSGYSPHAWDPPPWWYPVRRSAAAAWLQDGQFAKAADAAQKSLSAWPYDPLALLILSRANDGLGKREEARRYEAQAIGLWMGNLSRVSIATILAGSCWRVPVSTRTQSHSS